MRLLPILPQWKYFCRPAPRWPEPSRGRAARWLDGWVLLAHLQLLQGHAARARQILESVIAWIDADRVYGPVYNLRTRTQALMLLGRREDALKDLRTSFQVDHDRVEWWYTIERDPIWDDVRQDPEFRTLATEAKHFASAERAAVEVLRSRGEIPRRPAVTQSAVAGADP